ncbi:hypothetical protein L7F22_016989 [Adiantum nelumboides]|nr:hypothetical protein [Adiantum nelumboides]
MGPPSDAEIAARFERATRSVLASSSLASYSNSESAAREELSSQLPSLADLLTHVGPPDCQRCPSCRAPLLFGPRSRLCLACDATFIEISPPSLTSSIAFRRFSEALGLENDFGVAEEEHFQDKEVDNSIKSSASISSAPGDGGVQEGSLHTSFDLKTSSKEAIAATTSPHTSTSDFFSSVPPVETSLKQSNILDYSDKLEGISLEDFFSNQINPEASTPLKSDNRSVNIPGVLTSINTPGIQVRKDSLFWDPLSETIIPDGFDMMASTSELITNENITSNKMIGVEEDDDPFFSWEGDFQSAPLAIIDPLTSHSTSEAQSSVQPGEFEDFFGNPATSQERDSGESTGLQEINGWANDAYFFGSSTDITAGRNVDVDDLLFGSEWQQSVQPSATLATNGGSQSTNLFDGEEMFSPFSSLPKEVSSICDSSFESLQEGNSTATKNQPLTELHGSQAAGEENRLVGSLLAELHDLSFMLSDKLVIKTEGKNTQPNSSS